MPESMGTEIDETLCEQLCRTRVWMVAADSAQKGDAKMLVSLSDSVIRHVGDVVTDNANAKSSKIDVWPSLRDEAEWLNDIVQCVAAKRPIEALDITSRIAGTLIECDSVSPFAQLFRGQMAPTVFEAGPFVLREGVRVTGKYGSGVCPFEEGKKEGGSAGKELTALLCDVKTVSKEGKCD
jgi:hypothetical protein